MKDVVEWVLGRVYRPALVAAACAPLPLLGPFLTTPLLVLVTAHYGFRFGIVTAAAAGAVLTAIVAATGSDLALYTAGGVLNMLFGVAMGGLLRWGRSLRLAFQMTLLLCLLVTGGVSLLGPGPDAMFGPLLDAIIELARDDATPQELEQIRAAAPMMLGLMAFFMFVQLTCALLIGYWLLGYAREDVAFGPAFRSISLGRVLGIFGMVWVTLSLIVPLAVVRDLAPLLFVAFLFQGLSVMHAWAHARQWHPALLVAVYLLLVPLVPFVPRLSLVALMGLSGVGLLDNVFDLRAPLRA